MGKIIFQHKYINSSYRIRGNNPRIKIIKDLIKLIIININIGYKIKLVNKIILINLKKIIIPYSDKKINVEPP